MGESNAQNQGHTNQGLGAGLLAEPVPLWSGERISNGKVGSPLPGGGGWLRPWRGLPGGEAGRRRGAGQVGADRPRREGPDCSSFSHVPRRHSRPPREQVASSHPPGSYRSSAARVARRSCIYPYYFSLSMFLAPSFHPLTSTLLPLLLHPL